jgi:diguanylate cyclase (GGDEF)-like protein
MSADPLGVHDATRAEAMGRAHLAAADAALLAAQDQRAKEEAEAGLAAIGGTGSDLEVNLLIALAAAHGNLRQLDQRAEASVTAVGLARALGDNLLLGQAAAFAALALAESGSSDDFAEAVANLVTGSEALARIAHSTENLVNALVVLSHASLALGDLRSAAWFTDQAIDAACEGAPGALGFALVAEQRRTARQGLELERSGSDAGPVYARVDELGLRAIQVCLEVNDVASRLDAMLYRVLALGALGATDDCRAALNELREEAAEVGLPSWKAAFLGEAKALIAAGRHEEALDALDRARNEPVDDLLGEHSPWIHVERATAHTALGNHEAAADALRTALRTERNLVVQLSDRLNDSITARVHLKTAEREVAANRLRADRLADEALRDPLTGLSNRRGLEVAFSQASTTGHAMSVGVIDIDHFKRINDTYGHATGDRVLVAIAEALRACCRGVDVVGRLAGDEFVVAFADLDDRAAALAFERLRTAVSRHRWATIVAGLEVTISIGWAGPGDGPWTERLAAADEALYEVKRLGRNDVRASPRGGPL